MLNKDAIYLLLDDVRSEVENELSKNLPYQESRTKADALLNSLETVLPDDIKKDLEKLLDEEYSCKTWSQEYYYLKGLQDGVKSINLMLNENFLDRFTKLTGEYIEKSEVMNVK
ncbi:MAG: hypothetical protein JJT76_17515 [Clostridiaceae bacterium]|nr:hypothetical protein [Clostridiaceae bacterium]